jgi:hypothetical protein
MLPGGFQALPEQAPNTFNDISPLSSLGCWVGWVPYSGKKGKQDEFAIVIEREERNEQCV